MVRIQLNKSFNRTRESTFAGFWIGGSGRIMFGELPVSGSMVLMFAIGGVFAGAILGAVFPITSRLFSLPFAFWGGSPRLHLTFSERSAS